MALQSTTYVNIREKLMLYAFDNIVNNIFERNKYEFHNIFFVLKCF